MTLRRWIEKVAEKEVERITVTCRRYHERQGYAPRWAERGMGDRFSHLEQLEHRVQMVLGVFSTKGVQCLEFKPAHSVSYLVTQHVEELEQEAEENGGVMTTFAAHCAKVCRVVAPPLSSMPTRRAGVAA
jgi:hypothetical protein